MKIFAAALAMVVAAGLPSMGWAQKTAEDQKTAADIRALVTPLPKLSVTRGDLALAPELAASMGMISSIAADPKSGVIYLLQRGANADPVIAVDRDGKLLRSWGKGLYKMPHAVRVDPDGNVWTTDSIASTILKFTPKGEKLLEISVGGQPTPGKVSGTTDIAFGPNGRVFVADGYGNARIQEYTAAGKFVREWGTHGIGPGQFHIPHAIVIDPENTVFVADRENGRIERFDLDGKFLGAWDGFGKPMSLSLMSDGTLLVASGDRMGPGEVPDWVAWVVKIDRHTGKPLGYIEVGDDAHAQESVGGAILTGGETGKISAVHRFRP
ncbi:MAG: peptidyl-alpha-hydroxyglycine alpha-amidating lyase family protein [Rhodospirillaceae bacterium]